MRIIDSPRLWDNRYRGRQKTGFHILPKILILIFWTTACLLLINFVPEHKPPASGLASSTKPILADTIINSEFKSSSIDNLLPDSDNPSAFLLNKLIAMPPPLPSANCQVDACVSLTFDDGPNPDSSSRIVDAFRFERANTTFFVVGRNITGHETELKLMQDAGDEVGNHSWSHPHLPRLTSNQIEQEINQTQTAITAIGLPAPNLFRPPYEDLNSSVLKQIHLPIALWNVDPKDWAQKDADSIVKSVEEQIKPGAIVVMHDKKLTAEAVPKILKDLRGKYRFVTVSQLLNLQPGAQGVYVGR